MTNYFLKKANLDKGLSKLTLQKIFLIDFTADVNCLTNQNKLWEGFKSNLND